jgi:hypothetical protein
MYNPSIPSTSALDGVGGQRHAPAALPKERAGTHRKGGWVRKISPPLEFDLRTFQPAASRHTD